MAHCRLFGSNGFAVKICGMRDSENVGRVADLSPDMMGFIFYERSPRFVGELDVDIIRSLPHNVTPVALFVDEEHTKIMNICNLYGFKTVQLHGNERPEECRRLKDAGLSVIKAFGIDGDTDWAEIETYDGVADLFVLDSRSPGRGGSGRKFDWTKLENYPLPTPYLLSGGIGPDDLQNVMDVSLPGMVGIDLNSRFEKAPALKDVEKLAHFIKSLRNQL